MERVEYGFKAVSYTHLDVYKRQVYGSWSGGIFLLEIDKTTGLVIHPEAVSYTHLDVYKRQHQFLYEGFVLWKHIEVVQDQQGICVESLHHLIVILKTDVLIHFYGIICKCKVCDVFSQITGVIQINDIGVLFTVRRCV